MCVRVHTLDDKTGSLGAKWGDPSSGLSPDTLFLPSAHYRAFRPWPAQGQRHLSPRLVQDWGH